MNPAHDYAACTLRTWLTQHLFLHLALRIPPSVTFATANSSLSRSSTFPIAKVTSSSGPSDIPSWTTESFIPTEDQMGPIGITATPTPVTVTSAPGPTTVTPNAAASTGSSVVIPPAFTTSTRSTAAASVSVTPTPAPTISASNSDLRPHLSVRAGIGIAIAAGAVTVCLVLLIAGVWLMRRRRRRRKRRAASVHADRIAGEYRIAR